MFDRPPLLEEPFAQTLSGKTLRNLHDSDTIVNGYSARLSLRTHVAGIVVEAHTGCAAVLVQHLFPEAAPSRVVFGDHLGRKTVKTMP